MQYSSLSYQPLSKFIIILSLILGSKELRANQCLEFFEKTITISMPADFTESARVTYYKEVSANARSDFESFAIDRYGYSGREALEKLTSVGIHFRELVSDPGVVLRAEKFTEFIRSNNLNNEDPWIARELFSLYLGTRTVYRALNLTPFEHSNIMNNGIESALLRSHPDIRTQIRVLSEDRLDWQVSRRVRPNGINKLDPLMSISGDPTVAVSASSAARMNEVLAPLQSGNLFGFFAGSFMQPMKSVYLYKIKIPELDLIYYGLDKSILPTSYQNKNMQISVGSMTSLPKTYLFSDPMVESFILLKIDPHEIESGRVLAPVELAPLPYFSNTSR